MVSTATPKRADTRSIANNSKANTKPTKVKRRSSLVSSLELILVSLAKMFKASANDYCEIETVDGRFNLVMQDGTMVTILKYEGIRSTIDYHQTFMGEIDRLNNYLKNNLNAVNSHKIMVLFRRDDAVNSELNRIVDIQKNTARKVNIRLDSFIDEMRDVYAPYIYDEEIYFALMTNPKILDKSEIAGDYRRTADIVKKYNIPPMSDAQNLLHGLSSLKSIHDTFVSGVISELEHQDFKGVVDKLDVSAAITATGRMMNPRYFDPNFKAFLPNSGMPIPLRWKNRTDPQDLSHVLYPRISDQLMTQTITPLNSKDKAGDITVPKSAVQCGDMVYVPIPLKTPPSPSFSGTSSVMPTFIDFFDRMNQQTTETSDGSSRAIPYAVSFMLSGDGMASIGIKRAVTAVVGWQGAANQQIKAAGDSLQRYKDYGGCVVGLQVSLMTWDEATPRGIERLQIRRSKLWRAAQNWGHAVPLERTGDAVKAYLTHFPLSTMHHAPLCPAPLPDALHLLPLDRPASPFKKGTMVQRTPCGKLIRIEHFSEELAYNYTIISGTMGSGKSMRMNDELFEACLAAGLERLPYIFISDVGVSSSGLVYGIQNALDPSRKHWCVYKRISKSAKDAINPMETAVGLQYPLSNEFDQIRAFLVTLVTPAENEHPEPEMSAVISLIIREAFKFFATDNDQSQPKIYQTGQSHELDLLLRELRISLSETLPLHDLALLCHQLAEQIVSNEEIQQVRKNKLLRARNLAHRYAMPILSDLITVAKKEEIQRIYGDYKTSHGENILDAVTRSLSQAANDYPNFSTFTQFDISDARIASVDLQDVIVKNNRKNNSLFFQIVRMFYKKRIAYSEEDLTRGEIPKDYLDYYSNLVAELKIDKKYMVFDEMHNIKSDNFMIAELERDSREIRKWGIAYYLSSQYISDFGILTKAASRFVVCSQGSPEERKDIVKYLQLTPAQEKRLTSIVGLRSSGMTYLSKVINERNDQYVQFFTSMIGPKRLWLLTTNPEDQAVRSIMRKKHDLETCIDILATVHPRGVKTIVNTLKEQRALEITSSAALSLEEEENIKLGIYTELVDEAIKTYNFIQSQKLRVA
ncbi:ATP-binding protein [Acinetobacter baumannii]|uniref:ATP-binding protein n=1 Tax=Acinetobacter baumannii TaxID=470 RepID=UPI003A9854D8